MNRTTHPNIVPVCGQHNAARDGGPGLKVVLYLRQSDKEQRLSIAQQRDELTKYCLSRGWVIVGEEYLDDGKSGSKQIERRKAFHRMIADATAKGRKWQAIVVWDTSRFGRLDALKGAVYKDKLRDAGVWLESMRQGRIDWNTSQGRIMDTLNAEADNAFSMKLSEDVRRGRNYVSDLGWWASGKVPYGYDRAYHDETGAEVMRMPRNKTFAKPRNWRLKPVVNAAEAKVVTRIFREYVEKDLSLAQVIKGLRRDRVPNASGSGFHWWDLQVKEILKNDAYLGHTVIGRRSSKHAHARIDKKVTKDTHEPLVDQATFDAAQAKLAKRASLGGWKPSERSAPLSGVLYCGKCGYRLMKRTVLGRVKFCCESWKLRPETGCSQWTVTESEILPLVRRKLVEAVDFNLVAKLQVEGPKPADAKAVEELRGEERRLKAKYDKALRNILEIDAAYRADAQVALAEIKADYERARDTLVLLTGDAPKQQVEQWVRWWKANRAKLIPVPHPDSLLSLPGVRITANEVRAGIMRGGGEVVVTDADTIRSLLHELNVKVYLWWERYGATNKRFRLAKGEIRAVFTTDPEALDVRQVRANMKGAVIAGSDEDYW